MQPCAFYAQTGQQNSRSFTPGTCGPVDPAYIQLAEQTGGQPMFLRPSEMAVAGHLMGETNGSDGNALLYAASRLGGQHREYDVPVDTKIKRVAFSLSFDEPGTKMLLLRPSGVEVTAGEAGVELSDWTCGRIVGIDSPEEGNWQVKLSGAGRFWLRVTAQSSLYILNAEFVRLGGRIGHEGYFKIPGQPIAGREQTFRVEMSGALRSANFRLVSAAGDTIQNVAARQEGYDPEDREFFGTLILPRQPFRLAASGFDEEGFPFQRMVLQQFHATTVEIDPVSKIEDVHAGTSCFLTFRIRNYGENAEFHLLAVDSRGAILPVDPTDVEIRTGGSADVTVEVTVPRRTTPGTGVTVTLTAASKADADIHNGTSVDLSVVAP